MFHAFIYILIVALAVWRLRVAALAADRRSRQTMSVLWAGDPDKYAGPEKVRLERAEIPRKYVDGTGREVSVWGYGLVRGKDMAAFGLPEESLLFCRRPEKDERLTGEVVVVNAADRRADKADPLAAVNMARARRTVRKCLARVDGTSGESSPEAAGRKIADTLSSWLAAYSDSTERIDERKLARDAARAVAAAGRGVDSFVVLARREWHGTLRLEVAPTAAVVGVADYWMPAEAAVSAKNR